MLFLFLSKADMQFADKELTWRSYTPKEAMATIQRIEFISKKRFANLVLDKNINAFLIHVALFTLKITIFLA